MPAGKSTILYKDARFGFTLKIPKYWGRYCVLSKKNRFNDAEYTVRFIFRYGGKLYGPIFSIIVFRMTKAEWIAQGYGDSPLVFIAERDGYVFAYDTPEELPYEFVDPKTGDYDYKKYRKPIQILKTMVNKDVQRIIGSIRFPHGAITNKSKPYIARRIRSCRC
ncbi:hypothetical protein [Paenibacillus thalictri]|uniref:Uncharacterized protein n=1 Tax=Paenibacillus thalictri TaxID=2527873 RepID=A0A4Q9DTY4_9BACL|nr:hypothetical protein [Paenibacillus thalictri]TBL78677.1 hypothetical protein EYB31_14395 [Paenibacillus thalictri]